MKILTSIIVYKDSVTYAAVCGEFTQRISLRHFSFIIAL